MVHILRIYGFLRGISAPFKHFFHINNSFHFYQLGLPLTQKERKT
jgi:hypothetical protein